MMALSGYTRIKNDLYVTVQFIDEIQKIFKNLSFTSPFFYRMSSGMIFASGEVIFYFISQTKFKTSLLYMIATNIACQS
jgi:hypothetical protein